MDEMRLGRGYANKLLQLRMSSHCMQLFYFESCGSLGRGPWEKSIFATQLVTRSRNIKQYNKMRGKVYQEPKLGTSLSIEPERGK